MEFLKTSFLIIHLICCVALIAIVVLQSGKSSGLSGAFGGSSDTYLSKNKAKSRDARLTLATKWVAGVFVLLTIALNLI